MQNPAIESSAAFGQRTLAIFSDLQMNGLACLQKLGELNLAAFKATVSEGQTAMSTGQLNGTAFAGAADVQQQFVQRSLSYAQHVKEIDTQFNTALTKAGEALREEFSNSFAQFGAGFGQVKSFGTDGGFGAMQSVMASMIQSGTALQDSIKRASGMVPPAASTAVIVAE